MTVTGQTTIALRFHGSSGRTSTVADPDGGAVTMHDRA